MRDMHGDDMASLAAVRSAFWDTVGLYGFEEWQTPILEASGVFTGSLGADSDVVTKEMFRFSTLGGEDVCMRPEGTAGEIRPMMEQPFGTQSGRTPQGHGCGNHPLLLALSVTAATVQARATPRHAMPRHATCLVVSR